MTEGLTNLFHVVATMACGAVLLMWWADLQDRYDRKRRSR